MLSQTIPGPEPGLATPEGRPGEDAAPMGPTEAALAVVRRFPPTCRSVGLARHFLLGQLRRGYDDDVDHLALMLSELVTNAVQHAGTDFEVGITVMPQAAGCPVHVRVTDLAPGFPTPQEPTGEEPRGRGLRIVEALADSWGIETQRGRPGKTVWFTSFVGPAAPGAATPGRRPRCSVTERVVAAS